MMSNINNKKEESLSRKYFKKLVLILMLVQILDTYSTIFPGSIPSFIANEFLLGFSKEEQNSIMSFAGSIVSIGMYFLFFNQYLADKLGRKKMLAITVFGMGVATLGMFLSINYIMYMSFVFFLYFFFSSDIWLIYINEEAPSKKRAYYSNLLLTVGLIGSILMVTSRILFVSEAKPFWRGMTFVPMILGFSLTPIILTKLKESSRFLEIKDDLKKRSLIKDVKALFKVENKKSFKVILIMSFCYGFSGVFMGLFEKYIADIKALPQFSVSIIFLLTTFMVIIAYIVNGFLGDRIGRKPLLYLWAALLPLSVTLWTIGATIPENTFIIVLFSYSLTHISYWGLLGILRLIAIEILPTDKRGTGIGLRSLSGSIGGTVGLLVSSGLILIVGLGPTFIIVSLANLILIPLGIIFIKETKGVDLKFIK